MGFKFRYDALLSYRKHLKEKAEIDLSLARRRLNRDIELLDELKNNLTQANERYSQDLKKRMTSGLIRNYSDYVTALENSIEAQKKRILESEKVVKDRLEKLLVRTKQYKVFEKLKERDLKKWNQEQHLLEQKEIGEATLLRYGKEFV